MEVNLRIVTLVNVEDFFFWTTVKGGGVFFLNYYYYSLRTKDLVKLDRFNEHVLLVKERTLLELIFTKAPLMQWTNAFYRQITANHSPNWLSSRALGITLYQFHCLQSPFTAAHSL